MKELNKGHMKSLKDNVGMLWHYCLGHISKSYLKKAESLFPKKFGNSIIQCETCKQAKMTKVPSNTVRHRYVKVGHLIHTDLMGPINTCMRGRTQ